jgi:hypothetical protein
LAFTLQMLEFLTEDDDDGGLARPASDSPSTCPAPDSPSTCPTNTGLKH